MIVHGSLLQVLTLLVNVILPLLVALVTQKLTKSKYQAVLLALLASVTGFVSELIAAASHGTQFDIWTALFAAITGFVTAVAAHYGLWKPTGVSAKLQAVGARRKPATPVTPAPAA